MDYVSLHNHTVYSILDALSTPKELFNKAKELNQKAIAVTDHGTAAAVWDSYKASKDAGVKLIQGIECYFTDNNKLQNKEKTRHLILLAKNQNGYKNLLTLNRKGFDFPMVFGSKVMSVIDWNLLEQYSEDLICLTACSKGIVGQLLNNKKWDEAENAIKRLKDIFGQNFALEVQPHALIRTNNNYHDAFEQSFTNFHINRLAKKFDVKVVATTNSHYINKEDSSVHDTFLAIGARQPVYSNARIKYDLPEFYVKTGEEVYNFFKRNFPNDASKFVENSLFFADMCEDPKFVDPKTTNLSGKELPNFPIQDEKDYQEFLNWLENQNEKIKSQDEDSAFLRFRCEKALEKKTPKGKEKEFRERLEEELDVLDYQKFSSYMLIVADFLNWARNNDIPLGAGRGCLSGDSLVLTENGFKKLNSIIINDKVFTHTGSIKNVTNIFKYPIHEKCLSIKTDHSFGTIIMTKDHKVFASKISNALISDKKIKFSNVPGWIKIGTLNKGDLIFMTFPKRKTVKTIKKIFNIKNNTYCNGKLIIKNLSIPFNEDFAYFLGRFIGDGYTKSRKDSELGISFNRNDKAGIDKISKYLTKIGIKHTIQISSDEVNAAKIIIYSSEFAKLIKTFISDYKCSSNTKHLPINFRNYTNKILKSILFGLFDSDGSLDKYRETITTTSQRLAMEIKEALLFLKIPSSIHTQKAYIYPNNLNYFCKQSYKIRFRGLITNKSSSNKIFKNGYFCKIIEIKEVDCDKVYDITVEDDHSYLTSNYAVHNSAGGSIIGYLLDIHKADPVKYGLIFARFQNRQRTEAPDIDVDISKYKREHVIQYLRNKYGDDYIAAVSNFNEITPKVYARDLSRSCMLGDSRETAVAIGNAVADIIPSDIQSANQLKKNALFIEWSKKHPKFIDNLPLVGKIRNMSQHAAGFVIGKRPLVGLVPLRRDKEDYSILEFEKENTADSGLIKIDLLGLSTLDIIENTLKLIKESGKPLPTDHINFDLYDKPTYDLITSGNTYGVFQFGTSAGTIDLCKKIKPKNIEDLAIITTLARPAARDIRKAFIETREGKRKFSILHPSLKNAFEKTFGFGLFDESILKVGQDVAGWSMHSADRIRKMIKDKGKNPEKDAKLRKEFIDDSVKNGIEQSIAVKIWDEEVQKFAGYTFNKSHAIMYSFTSYTTAYLKAHYPLEFLLANLIFEVSATNAKAAKPNIDKIKQELRANKVNIIPPDINKSDLSYKVVGHNQLLTGLDALKYVSDDAIKDILAKRPFTSFLDFMTKVDSRKVRSNAIQALASAGALDSFGLSRKQIFLYCSDFRKKLQVFSKKNDPKTFEYPWPKEKDWSISELFALERYYLGEAIICTKKEAYGKFFNEGKYATISQIKNLPDKTQIPSIKGEIKDLFEFKVKKESSKFFGHSMAKLLIEDENGDQCSVTIFPDKYDAVKKRIKQLGKMIKLEEGVAINFAATINLYADEFGLILENFYAIQPAPIMPIDRVARKVSLKKTKSEPKNTNIDDLFSDIEDELYDEGLIEFNDEID